jgi:50S ribosomal protein L16 3-hydroxylase
MISSWLTGMSIDQFRAENFRRAPVAHPRTARQAIPFFSWDTIEQLVASPEQPDMLLVRNGRLLEGARPKTLADAQTLFNDGYSIVMRRCERHDPALRMLAETVAAEFEGDVSIQLYATPAGHHSFTWHYDVEDVFIAQTAGAKEYMLRENTVNPHPTLDAMPKDMHYERETTPTMASTLIPGDWLYIPSGWWHVARCIEDSLSISIGVLHPESRTRHGA